MKNNWLQKLSTKILLQRPLFSAFIIPKNDTFKIRFSKSFFSDSSSKKYMKRHTNDIYVKKSKAVILLK